MFASALVPHSLDETTLAEEAPAMRAGLIRAQLRLRELAAFSLVIVIVGPDGAGKGALLYRLYDWLDSRYLRTNAYGRPSREERARPPFWRYWRDLPARGEIGVVLGSWYNEPLLLAADGSDDTTAFRRKLHRINAFEAMLTAEGVRLVKVFAFISEETERQRLRELEKAGRLERHVLDEWGTSKKRRRRIRPLAEEAVRLTSTGAAPWIVLPAADAGYRDLAFGRIVLETLEGHLGGGDRANGVAAPAIMPRFAKKSLLDGLDLTQTLKKGDDARRLEAGQDRLARLAADKRLKSIPVVLAFEGHDAAGKGSSIRRLVRALDPRRFTVHPIAAPTDEERVRPYLWRFWRRLPAPGRTAIFDRSWYGRVLVERVEGFASQNEWLRAYAEINAFEEELVEHGHVLVKYWLAISKDEQLERFEARQAIPFKQHKIVDDDWRNRAKWDEYQTAIGDMLDRTSTNFAPWTLIEAEDKRYARVKIIETLIEVLERRLD